MPGQPQAPAVAPVAPTEPTQTAEPQDGVDPMVGEIPQNDTMGQEGDENPFAKEKFDAGVGVDEDADPKKYIEKLTGKLAQKLRDYNGTEQDVDLNKFVVNSLIPAAIPQMDQNDAKDVIKKVQDNIGKTDNGGEEDADMGDEPIGGDSDDVYPNVSYDQTMQNENIDDLINEILGSKKLKKNIVNKNPFKGKKFN